MRAHKERKEIEKHQLCVSLHVAGGTKGSKEKEQDRCDENHQKRRREMSERKNTAYKITPPTHFTLKFFINSQNI